MLSCLQDPNVLNNEPGAPEIHFDDLTRTSVTLIGSVENKDPNATYGFIITEIVDGEEKGATQEFNIEHLEEDNSFLWTADLAIGATYSARSFVTNGLSRKLSNRLTITTPSTSKPTLSNVTLVDGFLTASIKDDGGRIIDEVGFVAGDSPERKALLRKEKIPAVRQGNSFSITLNAFEPGNTLYFIAYARDEKEDVGYSPEVLEVVFTDQRVRFEDPHFEEYVVKNYDLNKDGAISYEEIQVIEVIDVPTDNITSVKEISLMPELRVLSCEGTWYGTSNGQLTTLSLEKNSKLTKLNCDNNQLETLDLSNNPLLDTIYCSGNQLSALSVISNPKLSYLNCHNNQLKQLDVSKNPVVSLLYCYNNQLPSLDISKCPELTYLDCHNNQLPDLDVSNNKKLIRLSCHINQLSQLDVSKNPDIEHFDCHYNQLSDLNVSNNTKLIRFWCHSNQISKLDLSKNTEITLLHCNYNQLRTLDISNNRDLNSVDCRENPMDTLFLFASQNPETLLVPEGTVLFYYIGGISLTEDSITVPVGETHILTAVLDPKDTAGKDITWSSSDETIAKVSDEGVVSGIAPGTCTITALCYGRKATCDVNVNIPVTSISFGTETGREVYISEVFTLTTEIGPNDATDTFLTWESSDPAVATVSSEGTVSPVGLGSAIISATTSSGISATFDCIVVSEAPVFPDEYFRRYVYDNFDTNKDGFLSRGEALLVRRINCNVTPYYNTLLASLEGIECFESLSFLCCNGTSLSSLDISHNQKLGYLDCSCNQLTTLDVSNNSNLQILDCASNQLTSLDVSHNLQLFDLFCSGNQLTSLDVSHNPDLIDISCESNLLTALDITYNPSLIAIYCGYNQLTSLDISHNTALRKLRCNSNQLSYLDISRNLKLESLNCEYNQLTSLDVSNHSEIQLLCCENNLLSSLEVSDKPNLGELRCQGNQLSELLLSNSPNLTRLYCYDNQISQFDISPCTKLIDLQCGKNLISSLDVSNCISLSWFYCDRNGLSELKMGYHPDLKDFLCYSNQLTSLDVTECPALVRLACDLNPYLVDIWLSKDHPIDDFYYDVDVATLHYE